VIIDNLLSCCAVCYYGRVPEFQRKLLPPSSVLQSKYLFCRLSNDAFSSNKGYIASNDRVISE
jgi:hypothetical protein